MIWYDSHKPTTLLRIHGSVLPRSMLLAVPSAIFAFVLRETELYHQLEHLNIPSESAGVYSGFTFVLGFSLVFRTSQSYARYWTAATSMHEMNCEWSDSCASLIAFTTFSTAATKEVAKFRHTVVRLYSLMHAMALSEVAGDTKDLPLLDIQGLSKEQLGMLTTKQAQGKKVQIVMSWLKAYISQMAYTGLLNVPAPILTRVFQELGHGLVHYHKALQVVIWPFPFPYTQMNWILIFAYTVITPVVVSSWTHNGATGCFFTLVSVTCMVGLDAIACELENPFGDDANDLPVMEMQQDMNRFLALLLDPLAINPPELLPCALHNSKDITFECANTTHRLSKLSSATLVNATKCKTPQQSASARLWAWATSFGGTDAVQKRWRGESVGKVEISRLQEWLGCPSEDSSAAGRNEGGGSVWSNVSSSHVANTESKAFESEKDAEPCEEQGPGEWRGGRTPRTPVGGSWSDFLGALHTELREHLDQQLEIQKQELRHLEALLLKWKIPGSGSSLETAAPEGSSEGPEEAGFERGFCDMSTEDDEAADFRAEVVNDWPNAFPEAPPRPPLPILMAHRGRQRTT